MDSPILFFASSRYSLSFAITMVCPDSFVKKILFPIATTEGVFAHNISPFRSLKHHLQIRITSPGLTANTVCRNLL